MREAHTLELMNERTAVRVVLWINVKESLRHLFRPSLDKPLDRITVVPWATTAERESIRRGEVLERVIDVPIPASGTTAQKLAAMQATIVSARAAAQTEITNQQPHPFYGYVHDGTSWTAI